MKIIERDFDKNIIIDEIKDGKIFIYPTDTIYGLGCDATNTESVKKIREIKKRVSKPMSVIAPSKEWVVTNCNISLEELDKLPGPYTYFLKLRNNNAVSHSVNPIHQTLGVRIPEHWFSELVSMANVPFITTSVNLSGRKHMENIEDLPKPFKGAIDYIIYEGPISGAPSIKIDLTNK